MPFQDEIMSFYTYLQSQETAQKFLYKCYQKLPDIDAERKSYENCNTFLYCLEHGRTYYHAGETLDMVVKPVMFFYGMTHLLKALLLTRRPDYPESTTVLAHGVSTRKRKKKNYRFLTDEVKIQHHGLFPYFSEHLFHLKPIPFDKIMMKSLLSLVPELIPYFKLDGKGHLVRIGSIGSEMMEIPIAICEDYHITENAFIKRLSKFLPPVDDVEVNQKYISIRLKEPMKKGIGPFQFTQDKAIFLPINRDLFFPISEVMIHYLLLYNLSMLSRYEAEWWGELLATKPDKDYPYVARFLEITGERIPRVIGEMLSSCLV